MENNLNEFDMCMDLTATELEKLKGGYTPYPPELEPLPIVPRLKLDIFPYGIINPDIFNLGKLQNLRR